MFNKENNFTQNLNDKLLSLKLSKLDKTLNLMKKSYPNFDEAVSIPGQYNMERWIQALKDTVINQHQGLEWKVALDRSTQGWNPLERNDFVNWVKFYQEGGHLKYKMAQSNNWYESPDENMVGYFVPNAMQDGSMYPQNTNLHSDIGNVKDSDVDDFSPVEKKRIAEKQRKKIISRLDSIEKLIRSDEGHLLTESEFDSLMESIYSLKKKVSTLKKKTSGDAFYKDLIIRQANVLARDGFYKAASFLYVVADGQVGPPPATSPAPTEGKVDGGGTGLPGSLPAAGPAGGAPMEEAQNNTPAANEVPAAAPAPAAKVKPQDGTSEINEPPVPEPKKPEDKGMAGLLAGMGGDVQFTLDDNFLDEILVTEAQAAEMTAPAPTPAAPAPETPITNKQFDDKLDSLLSNVTIEDVVTKMEEISKVFKTREIPRQLAIVDMMLDRLGLASFFPSLSEAINKSLESNNYVLTRIDGIMSQLTGAMKMKEIDLTHEKDTVTPEATVIKQNLQEKEQKEKERKELKQELADKALQERAEEAAPELEVTEEDIAPAVAPTPTAAPATPAPVAAPAPVPPTA